MRYSTPDNIPIPDSTDVMPPLEQDIEDIVNAVQTALKGRAKLDDTGWIYPDPQNGWKNQSGTPLRYRRLNGVTWLQGYISGGTATTVFTIPAGFRPSQQIRVGAINGTGGGTSWMSFPVGADGVIAAGTTLSPNFDCSWPADQ